MNATNNFKYYKTKDEKSIAFEDNEYIVFSYGNGGGNLQEINLEEYRDICCKLNCLCKNEVIDDILIPSISKCY